MFEPAGFDVCLTVGLVLFAFGVALPYVRLALGRPSGGIDGAPTVFELFGEGKGWRGTRLDISYDIALIGVLFILQATAQTNYPDGYLKTIHLGVTVWPMLSLVYVVFKLVQLQSSRVPDKTFDRMFSMGRWFMCRRRRCWCRAKDYQVTANSVYSDPHVPLSSIALKVLTPQVIGMIMYISFIFKPWRYNARSRRFGIFAIFFTPVFVQTCEFTIDSIPTVQLLLFLRFLAANPDFVDERGVVVTVDQAGEQARLSTREIVNTFGGPKYAIRVLLFTVVNYCSACVLSLSLPIFLAQSENQIDFILNALAAAFIIQLDDTPDNKMQVTISDGKMSSADNLESGEKTPVSPQ